MPNSADHVDLSKAESTKEDKKLTLVETIEELGFIPSIDENDKNNVAWFNFIYKYNYKIFLLTKSLLSLQINK